jgi:hypothetical protein
LLDDVAALERTGGKSFRRFFGLAGRPSRHVRGVRATVGWNLLPSVRPRWLALCQCWLARGARRGRLVGGSGSECPERPHLAGPGHVGVASACPAGPGRAAVRLCRLSRWQRW